MERKLKQVGETGIVELALLSKKIPTLIHNVQLDPVTDIPIHTDFLQVDLKEKVTAQVPVELSGESPAEKQGLGTVVQHIDEVEVEALPTDLPEKFEVDLSALDKVDMLVQIKDLKVDKNVAVKDEADRIIVKVEPPRKEEEEVPVEKEEEVEEEEAEKEEGKEEAPAKEKTEKEEEGKEQEAKKKSDTPEKKK
jgi:large subunit ribosomal protein L25